LAKVQLRKQKNKKMMSEKKYAVAYCLAKEWEKNRNIGVHIKIKDTIIIIYGIVQFVSLSF
jgi:hypothetical protein